MDRFQVVLQDRSYPVFVGMGGLEPLGAAMAGVLPAGPCVLVTSPRVGGFHGDAALASLRAAGFSPARVEIPDGEAAKTLDTWVHLVHALLDAGIDRTTPVVALGGGVTGDVAGFAAATVLRGVPLVQVPTSLLAMADAAIGGKTGVNLAQGRNLVGAFHPPRLVWVATAVLSTLDDAEFGSGLGEVVKHAVVADADLFAFLEERHAALRARDPVATAHGVRRCCALKAEIVAQDERDTGVRRILNFGHTAGHALETALGPGTIRHGEAVSVGMLAEARFWAARGGDVEVPARLSALLEALGLPRAPPPVPDAASFARRLVAAAAMDKKSARGTLELPVPVRVGCVRLERIPRDDLHSLLSLLSSPETS
ncbi:MAG: 3-dehydroquinate synthase [Deltaproteobacteria bacterium]|nr:3-dehydroquinate synthase [Deltaproteobacteria bacterium]